VSEAAETKLKSRPGVVLDPQGQRNHRYYRGQTGTFRTYCGKTVPANWAYEWERGGKLTCRSCERAVLRRPPA
jgi:hypothetical protein